MNEQELIQLSKQGNLEAFNQLVLIYQEAAYNQALWILKDPDAAEDATQVAFIQAYKHIDKFHGNSFKAWLHKIVLHTCYDELRRWKHKPVSLEQLGYGDDGETELGELIPEVSKSVEDVIESTELKGSLLKAIEKLSDDYRNVLFLVDISELNYSNAAAVLNIPEGTVKSRLSRARLRLRELLAEKECQNIKTALAVPSFLPCL